MRIRDYDELIEERGNLKAEILQLETLLENSPKGRIERVRGHDRFWLRHVYRSDGRLNYKNIRKSERTLATRLGNKAYAKKLLPILKSNLKALDHLIKNYHVDAREYVASDLESRQIPVSTNLCRSRAERIRDFLGREYPEMSDFITGRTVQCENGDFVRSKSEARIYEALCRRGIVFRYEIPIMLASGRTVYPDFVIYLPEVDKIIIWEHFGLMDDQEYVERTCRKITEYSQSGYVVGENLIITMETMMNPLSSVVINNLIDNLVSEYKVN